MGGGWSFGSSRSFLEPESGAAYIDNERDDGWWIDDIKLTDLRIGPKPIVPDAGTGSATCAIGDTCGTVDAVVANSVPFPLAGFPDACLIGHTIGQTMALDARASTSSSPACEQGELLYEWSEIDMAGNPIDVLSPMSPAAKINVAPTQDTKYKVTVMCSTDPACMDMKVVQVSVYQGKGCVNGAFGGDLDVDYGAVAISATPASTRVFCTQTMPVPPNMPGYDVHRIQRGDCGGGFTCTGVDPFETTPDGSIGVFGGDIDPLVGPDPDGACWVPDIPFPGFGGDAEALDVGNPPLNEAYFYQVGCSGEINFAAAGPTAGQIKTVLGMSDDPADALRTNLGACCSLSNASCGSATSPVLP
jgi:hypothetical protein